MNIESYLIEAHIIKIVDSKLEFLLLKRAESESYPGIWQMVTGSIDSNETAVETALREINEETSLTLDKFWVVPNVNSFYSAEDDEICLVPVFIALVDDSLQVKISSEHSEYKWTDAEDAKRLLAWSGQRKSVEIIYDYFTNDKSTFKFIEIKI